MKKIGIYVAGPLFTKAYQKEKIFEGNLIKESCDELSKILPNIEFDIYNPITADINDKSKLPESEGIYDLDYEKISGSEIVFACLDEEDAGTMMEIGQAIEQKKFVIAYATDMRIATAGKYEGIRVPFGLNQYVIGGLFRNGVKIHSSIEEAVEHFKNHLKETEAVDAKDSHLL